MVSVSATGGHQKEASSGSLEKQEAGVAELPSAGDVDMAGQIFSMKRYHIWLSC